MLYRTRSLVLSGLLGLCISLTLYAQPAVEPDTSSMRRTPAETTPAETAPTDTPADADTPPLTLQSQEPAEVNSLAQLDAENQKLGAWIRQGLASLPDGARIRLGQFLMSGQETPLGIYWRNQLSSILSSMQNRNFVIINNESSQADYALSGDIMPLGNVLRIYTRLTKQEDSSLITTWNLDLLRTSFIETLIGTSGSSSGSGSSSSGSASGISPDRYEPDSRENPVQTETGSPEIARTLHEGDEDWFSIRTESNGTLILETTGSLDIFMELYDSNSASRLSSDDDGGSNLNARIEYFAEAGKTYIVKVRGVDSDTGSYGFKATFTPVPVDSFEPNDTQEQAASIPLGTQAEANFHSSSDADWYKTDIPEEGGMLTVYSEGRLDTYIELYDAEGTMLAENDDSGSGLNARISLQVSGGTVYICVREVDGDRGAYTLYTYMREPGRSDDYEPDNSIETAGEIQIGTSQERTFTAADDSDWVKFTVTESGGYEIRTIAADQVLDTYIELYDENGEYLDDDDDSGDNYDAYLKVQLDPGTYFIKIFTLDDDPLDNNAYTLSASASSEE